MGAAEAPDTNGGAAMSSEVAPLTAIRRRRARIALVVLGVTVVAVVAMVVVGLTRSRASTTTSLLTATASRKTIHVTVSGTGSTAVKDAELVYPEVSGTVKSLCISLGDKVAAGTKLYAIDAADVESAILQANTQLLQAKESRIQASAQYTQAEQALTDADSALTKAEDALTAAQGVAAGTPGRYTRVSAAQSQVTRATSGVDSAQANVDAAVLGVKVARANVTSAQDAYDKAVAKRDKTVVTAPIAGVVTNLPISVGSAVTAGTSGSGSGSSSSGSGSSATAASSSSSSSSGSSGALTISDLNDLDVEISISEVDVAKLKVGQKATVTFDAISDKTFSGKVASIANGGTSSSGVVSYAVVVELDARDSRLKPDMSASVDVDTQVADNALVVPSTAVKTSGTGKYVQVVGPSGTTNTTVTVGVSDDTYTQITNGLKDGTVVSTGSTSSGSSTSSTAKSSGSALPMGAGGPPVGRTGRQLMTAILEVRDMVKTYVTGDTYTPALKRRVAHGRARASSSPSWGRRARASRRS